MKRTTFFFVFLIPFLCSGVEKHSCDHLLCRLKGSDKNEFIRIPPPQQFLEKSAQEKTCNIEVTYNDFTDEAKGAFAYAVSIWEKLLVSQETIYVDATWREFPNPEDDNVLGAAGASEYYINKKGMTQADVFFNAPLAEKIVEKSINTVGRPDIYAYFSNEVEWYYGTDGNTPAGKYDLVSVVLHELCHGLGFIGSLDVDNNIGSYGFGTHYPFSWDRFIVNGEGEHLTDWELFTNPSSELYQQMVSDDLYFDGPVVRANIGEKAKLYVPTSYEPGSSIDHLDADTYDGTTNSLMTPSISKASSIHNPGLVTLSMLNDMGWENVCIKHDKPHSIEQVADVDLVVQINADFETDFIDPKVVFFINDGEVQSISLQKTDTAFNASIPVSVESKIDYYLSVNDKYGRAFYFPTRGEDQMNTVYVGKDTVPPTIEHIPNRQIFDGEEELVILGDVEDLYGVESVWLEYFINNSEKTPLELRHYKGDTYDVILDFSNFDLSLGDVVKYRLVAYDNASGHNKQVSPQNGYYELTVSEVPEFITTYETNFDAGANEFILSGFDIEVANGFTETALNSEHPYQNGGQDTYLDFTAELKFPIKLIETDHYIRFDEIALIEPGELGTAYGDEEFWDYVVVEGSADNGETWIPFEDGWDCRLHQEWIDNYAQSQHFNNSDLIEEQDLFRGQSINMTHPNEFSVGDIIKVRFRLHSDPFATGWGWAIDNLQIQTVGLDVSDVVDNGIKVYPNPVYGSNLRVKWYDREIINAKIVNLFGQNVCEFKKIEEEIILPNQMNEGIYILILHSSDGIFTDRFIYKHN